MRNTGEGKRIWGSMAIVMLFVIIFDLTSHMWGPGIYDWSPIHHLSITVEMFRGWIRIVGLPLTAFLLYVERKGVPLGKYWVLYPIVRLLYDTGWMAYFGNPYPSWYVQDFGAFLVCMAPAFVIDAWGTSPVAKAQATISGVSTTHEKIKLMISIVSLITALVGLLRTLVQ